MILLASKFGHGQLSLSFAFTVQNVKEDTTKDDLQNFS